mgnify:CR=1 FL=1
MLWIGGWALVCGVLVRRIRSVLVIGVSGVVIALTLRQACLVMLVQGRWVPFIPALFAITITLGITAIYSNPEIQLFLTSTSKRTLTLFSSTIKTLKS